MKPNVPNYLISMKKFCNNTISENEFVNKRWTQGMIALLGEPIKYNAEKVPFYSLHRAERLMQSKAFAKELLKMVDTKLQVLGGVVLVNDEELLLLAGCNALYDLNKHIKAKKFQAAEIKKAYDLKTFFLHFLYENGYATKLVFEQDTNLYRFTVEVAGMEYVWHQPPNRCSDFIHECGTEMSNPPVERPINDQSHNRVMKQLERVVLSIVADNLKRI
jgi:hypothetical protein